MSSQLTNYVDFIVRSLGRRISPRLDPQVRLERLVDEEFATLPDDERAAMVGLVLLKFADLTVTRAVAHHPMTTRSKSGV
jgi:hypothetical protein